MIDLEQLITEAYDLHIAQEKDEERQRLAQEEARKQTAIAQFRESFDLVFTADLQNAMRIKVDADEHRTFATFVYQGTQFYIFRFGQEDWKVETDNGDTFAARSSKIINRLFIAMGAIRAVFSRKELTLEKAADKLIFSLCEAEQVYDHSVDFLDSSESEAFGEKLKTAISVLNDLSIILTSKLESQDRTI